MGPNGSGKSTLYQNLRSDGTIHTEIYVSADRIEAELKENKRFVFNAYRISVSEEEFFQALAKSGLFTKRNIRNPSDWFSLSGGILYVKPAGINSYSAAFIASYLAEKLISRRESFCFETVMSHPSKIDMLHSARTAGYKIYLYFVYIRYPELNVYRVRQRAKQGGHNVDADKIRERYKRSFKLLPTALKISDRAYLLDNTEEFETIAEKEEENFFWYTLSIPNSLKPVQKLYPYRS
ncbi:zeta toxin family protein [Leptospira koniambonensis]